jgi:hypothetical protein
MVKTKLLMLTAVAGMGMLAACSADETVEDNPGLEISFAPGINKGTRAADVTVDSLQRYGFNVTSIKNANDVVYFKNVGFEWNGSAYGSAIKYYWPATEALDFYAYSTTSAASSQVKKIDYNSFGVTPSTDWKNQVDLVFAATRNKVKTDGENGIVLNFRHTGAKIQVKVKNSSKTLKFDVEGWKVGFLSDSARFTFPRTENTDGQGTATLLKDYWTAHKDRSIATEYKSEFATKHIAVNVSTLEDLPGQMIMLPQTTPTMTAYTSAADGANVNNPYIALKMIIRNNDSDGTIVASEVGGGAIWATWPLPTAEWLPGKVYTYLVDLSGGGYYPGNKPGTDPDLDPLLTEIKFISVSVDDWEDGGSHNVGN